MSVAQRVSEEMDVALGMYILENSKKNFVKKISKRIS